MHTEFQADYGTSAFELTLGERADEPTLDGLVGTLGRWIPDDVEDADSCIIVQGSQDMVELCLRLVKPPAGQATKPEASQRRPERQRDR